MRLQEGATAIRPTSLQDLDALVALRRSNRGHTGPWEPVREDAFYTPAGQRIELDLDAQAWAVGSAYPFSVLAAGDGDRLVGRVALANIVRGAWQNATLGYWIAHSAAGHGHATRAVALALRFAFEHARLHRVQPAVIPRNTASIRVVERNGFRREGHAERYLQINGVWEDHTIFALTAEEWRARNGG
jgi:ribosomal-protein-alanine N-acetyltransferase